MNNLNLKLQYRAAERTAGAFDARIITQPACRRGELVNLLSVPADCVL